MNYFLKYVLIFISPLVVVMAVFEVILRNIPNDYTYKKNILDQQSNDLEYLFIGNSHILYGIDPAYISPKSFNVGGASQSLDIDYHIIKKYDGNWKNLKCIVLTLDYFSLYFSLGYSTETWRLKNYVQYFGLHEPFSNRHWLYSEFLDEDALMSAFRLKNYYIDNENPITCSKSGWSNSFQYNPHKNLERDGKRVAKKHTIGDYFIVDQNIDFLNKIVAYANSHDIKILLITFPTYPTYYNNLEKNQLNRTFSTAKNLVQKYPNVTHLNMLKDTSFTANDFYDPDHLNKIGAKKLSLKIKTVLDSL